ncbi:MAG: hypothetical protein ACYC5W_10265 [Thauera sp.]
MKIRSLLTGLAGLAAIAAGATLLSAGPASTPAVAQTLTRVMPEACVCSPGLDLGAQRGAASVLHNCQCGGLQCVVHVQSGQLQCR